MYFDFLSRFLSQHTLSLRVCMCVCVYVYALSHSNQICEVFSYLFFTLAQISKCNKIKRKSSTFFFVIVCANVYTCTYIYIFRLCPFIAFVIVCVQNCVGIVDFFWLNFITMNSISNFFFLSF